MSKAISMSVSDEAYVLWDQFKRDTDLTQNDAMTKLIVDALKPKKAKDLCAVDIARERRTKT